MLGCCICSTMVREVSHDGKTCKSRPSSSPLPSSLADVQSLANSIRKLGYKFAWVKTPDDVRKADVSGKHRVGGKASLLLR